MANFSAMQSKAQKQTSIVNSHHEPVAALVGNFEGLQMNQKQASVDHFSVLPPELLSKIFRLGECKAILSRALLLFALQQIYESVTIKKDSQLENFASTITTHLNADCGSFVRRLDFCWDDCSEYSDKFTTEKSLSAFFKAFPHLRKLIFSFFANATQILSQPNVPQFFPQLRKLEIQYMRDEEKFALDTQLYRGLDNVVTLIRLDLFCHDLVLDSLATYETLVPKKLKPNKHVKNLGLKLVNHSSTSILKNIIQYFSQIETLRLVFPPDSPLYPTKNLYNMKLPLLENLHFVEASDQGGARPPWVPHALDHMMPVHFPHLTTLVLSPSITSDSLFRTIKTLPIHTLALYDVIGFPYALIVGLTSGANRVPTLKRIRLELPRKPSNKSAKKLNKYGVSLHEWEKDFPLTMACLLVENMFGRGIALCGSFVDAYYADQQSGRTKAEWRAYEDRLYGKENRGKEIQEEPEDMSYENEELRIFWWAMGRMIQRQKAVLLEKAAARGLPI